MSITVQALLDQQSKNPNVQWKKQQILAQEIRVFLLFVLKSVIQIVADCS